MFAQFACSSEPDEIRYERAVWSDDDSVAGAVRRVDSSFVTHRTFDGPEYSVETKRFEITVAPAMDVGSDEVVLSIDADDVSEVKSLAILGSRGVGTVVVDRGQVETLRRFALDGSESSVLWESPGSCGLRHARPSPDGTLVAAVSFCLDADDPYRVEVLDIDTGAVVRDWGAIAVPLSGGGEEVQPRWALSGDLYFPLDPDADEWWVSLGGREAPTISSGPGCLEGPGDTSSWVNSVGQGLCVSDDGMYECEATDDQGDPVPPFGCP